jgi:hypothetical protein
MRRYRLLILAAWLFFLASWFLPVIEGGVIFPHDLPGWEAFRIAACPVWPYEGTTIDGWYNAVLSTISALTTVGFIAGSPWIVFYGSRALRRVSAWVAICAFVVNAQWYVYFLGSERKDLRIGYFLWWSSFLLMSLGLFVLSRTGASESVESR